MTLTQMLISALHQLFSWECISVLIIGVVAGMIVGALPGLSASMAVALLVPVTFKMAPAPGLVMLTAVYTSAIYGGSVTACLIHTPGTPASAATALDGFPLTKQGKGLKAIGISTISSMIGGTVSAFALLIIAPQLAKVSLLFSSLEYFLLACFGLTIIGSMSGENMMKGLISGALGLFFGTIGMDPITAYPRFTFGSIALESGIQLVPAMIGLFAISQVMVSIEELYKGKNKILEGSISDLVKGSPLPSAEEMKSILPTIGISSIIGIMIGILPGTGADIGSWVAYNNAKKRSKHPELFGKGAIEGIAASEASNNAVTGGAIIPMLTLGIPGSGVCAIMLGGMMIHGLNPGYELFSRQGEITYAIILGFLIANILMGVLGLLAAKFVVRICVIPSSILIPIIIGLATIGAYAIQNSRLDVTVMVIFGLIGYFARKLGFATAPMILGMILGPMAEKNWIQVTAISRGHLIKYFFSRPISIVLFIMVLAGMFTPMFMRFFSKKAAGDEKAVGREN